MFPYLASPLLELPLIRLECDPLLTDPVPVLREQLPLLLYKPPLLAQLPLPLSDGLPPLLEFNGCDLQVSQLPVSEVTLIVLSLLLQAALQVVYLLLFSLEVQVCDTLLGTTSLLFTF